MPIALRIPTLDQLPGYEDAVGRGWQPHLNSGMTPAEHLAKVVSDRAGFVRWLDDPEGQGPAIRMPDGSTVPRLPCFQRWIWDEGFCGVVGFRWQPGTAALPPSCLGHIGYMIVPWKQKRGYATAALAAMLDEARTRALPYVEITTDPANLASQKVVLANGGVLIERFRKVPALGGGESLRFRINL